MSFGRLARLVGIGLLVTVVIVVVIVAATSLFPSSSDKHDVTVNLKTVKDSPDYFWAAVYVPEPLTDDGYRKVAETIGDEELQSRCGQVMVFDDEWARSMVLPENQSIDLSHEEMARWEQHLRITYVHDAKGFWFDREGRRSGTAGTPRTTRFRLVRTIRGRTRPSLPECSDAPGRG
jgi:hypothetical protein